LAKIERALKEKNILFTHCYDSDALSPKEVFEEIRPRAEGLAPYLADVSLEIETAIANGKKVLFEGAQGTHLDLDHGTYPFVTSSNTVAANAAAGSGTGLANIENVLAVVKAYTTRVGQGPFPTELHGKTGQHLLTKGMEYGSTTGRKRRCGWLDLALLRESMRLNCPTEIALTKLDVLSGLEEIQLCIGYLFDGQEWSYPPPVENALAQVEPVYQSLAGWDLDLSQVTSWSDLPYAAQQYITTIEDLLNVRVGMVSVGPDRQQTLFL
jgi:adenylosuccinate synthase